jgi:hypothetical protein
VAADYLLRSRLAEYESVLSAALDVGYRVAGVRQYWHELQQGSADRARPTLVLRHDIDTDPGTAARIWEIERRLGVHASWYFRLSTLDVALMQAIEGAGGEASYHYEEIATVAKREHLTSRDAVTRRLGDIRSEFLANLRRLRAQTGLPMTVVASHGDFVNRKLDLPNWALLADGEIRSEAGVELEVYDDAFMRHVTSRHSDTLPPAAWIPASPLAAIAERSPLVYLLVHPRNWHADRRVNTVDNLRRAGEGMRYLIGGLPRRGTSRGLDRP